MKNLTGLLIKLFLFLLIFFMLLNCLGDYFISKKSGHRTWESFYMQPKKSIDILFMGNSHVGNGIDLNIINVKTKANASTIYSSGKVLDQIYYSFEEALRYQSPKLLVIETFAIPSDSIYYFKNPVKENEIPFNAKIQSFDSKKLNFVKYREYNDLYKEEKFLRTFFPTIRNHSNWSRKDFIRDNIFNNLNKNNSFYKGSSNSVTMLSNERVKEYEEKSFKKRVFRISNRQRSYFNKIKELAKVNGIEIVLLTIPYFKEYRDKINYKSFHDEINNLASENNIKHLDLNVVFKDWDNTYFSNENVGHNQHVNYKGAIELSNYLANYIQKNFNFKEKREHTIYPEYYLYNNIIRDSLNNGNRILGNLDKLNGTKRLKFNVQQGKSSIVLYGWAAIENQESKNNEIFIGLKSDDGKFYVSKETQFKPIKRTDVSKYFKKGNIYDHTGFHINVNSMLLHKGLYKIFMIVRSPKGEVLVKNSGKSVEII